LTPLIGLYEICRERVNEKKRNIEIFLFLFEDVPCADDWRDRNETIQQI
jgi:hypothetical protein